MSGLPPVLTFPPPYLRKAARGSCRHSGKRSLRTLNLTKWAQSGRKEGLHLPQCNAARARHLPDACVRVAANTSVFLLAAWGGALWLKLFFTVWTVQSELAKIKRAAVKSRFSDFSEDYAIWAVLRLSFTILMDKLFSF